MAVQAFGVQDRTQIVLTQVSIEQQSFSARYTSNSDLRQQEINISGSNLVIKATQLVLDFSSIQARRDPLSRGVDQVARLLERFESAKDRFDARQEEQDARAVLIDLIKGLKVDREV